MARPIPSPVPTTLGSAVETPATSMVDTVPHRTVMRIESSTFSEVVTEGYDKLGLWIGSLGVPEPWPNLLAAAICLFSLLILSMAAYRIFAAIIPIFLRRVVARWNPDWADVLESERVLHRAAHLAPLAVLAASESVLAVFGLGGAVQIALELYTIWILIALVMSITGLVLGLIQLQANTQHMPIQTVEQAINLLLWLVGILLAISILSGRSPIFFLSGIGALTAILMLVFRDTLLGMVAGIILALNDMVRVGDWIEIPGTAVNGDVTKMTLTTVRVQNFDRTTVLVPAYDLISKSVINWRGMVDSGGRRIKRAIYVDMSSVKFIDREMLERFKRFDLLGTYLDEKIHEIDSWTQNHPPGSDAPINSRRQTNVGVYRAYCVAYLREHPKIHNSGFTFMVRQLAPSEQGLPIELYVFTNDNRWVEYENIQADIFDHLLAAAGEFGLAVFQNPTGSDIRTITETPPS